MHPLATRYAMHHNNLASASPSMIVIGTCDGYAGMVQHRDCSAVAPFLSAQPKAHNHLLIDLFSVGDLSICVGSDNDDDCDGADVGEDYDNNDYVLCQLHEGSIKLTAGCN